MSSPIKISSLVVPLLLFVGRSNAQDGEPRSFRVYEVRDLLSRPTDFRAGTILGVRKPVVENRKGSEDSEASSVAHRGIQSERLAKWIEASLSAESRRDLRVRDGQLLFTATAEAHDELARLLGDLRRDRALGVTIDAVVIPVSEDALAALPSLLARKIRRAAFEGVLPRVVQVAEEELDALLASIPEDLSGEAFLPRVTAFNHQVSHGVVVSQAALVVDVEVSKEDGETKAEPVVGILNTGTVIQIQPSVDQDGSSIALGLKIETAKRKRSRVVPASELERFKDVPEVGDWSIEIPELERSTFETTVNLPASAWVLVGSLRSDSEDQSASPRAVLIRGAVVEPEE